MPSGLRFPLQLVRTLCQQDWWGQQQLYFSASLSPVKQAEIMTTFCASLGPWLVRCQGSFSVAVVLLIEVR